MSINTTVLMGRITHELELKNTSNGIAVLNFAIAVDRKRQASGEDRKTDFFDCVAWRNTAEFISKYFTKGQMIAIEGELQTDTYTDKDGNKRKKVEILVNNASFCGSKTESSSDAPAPTFAPEVPTFEELQTDGDLPF